MSRYKGKVIEEQRMKHRETYDDEAIDFPDISVNSHEEEKIIRKNWENAEKEVDNMGWNIFQEQSPVVAAWSRWYDGRDIKVEELAAFLNVSELSTSLHLVKKYLIGDEVYVPIENIKEVLEISDMLLLNDLVNYCKYRVQEIKLNTDNFMEILEVSSIYDFVHPNMKQFIRSHLSVLNDVDGAESLTYDTLLYLLTDEEHLYWSMKDRFVFIVKWCEASLSRNSLFQSLLDLIDLSHFETEYLESVVLNTPLVTSSEYCLRRTEDFLRKYACDILTPAVIMLDSGLSEIFAFSLENSCFSTIDCPSEVSSRSISACTVLLPDCIVVITDDELPRRDLIKYNINSGQVKTKRLVGAGSCKGDISHFLYTEDNAFFVGHDTYSVQMKDTTVTYKKKKRQQRHTTKTGKVPFSTVYKRGKENVHNIIFQPVILFRFKINHMCVYNSRLLIMSDTEEYIYCYDWESNTLKRLALPQDFYDYVLLSILQLHDTLFAVFPSFFIKLTLDEKNGEIQYTQKVYLDIGADTLITLATDDSFLRVDNECVHVIELMESAFKCKSNVIMDGFVPCLSQINIHFVYFERNILKHHLKYPQCDIDTDIEYFDDEDVDFRKMYRYKIKETLQKMIIILNESNSDELRRYSSDDPFDYDDSYDYDDFYDYDDSDSRFDYNYDDPYDENYYWGF